MVIVVACEEHRSLVDGSVIVELVSYDSAVEGERGDGDDDDDDDNDVAPAAWGDLVASMIYDIYIYISMIYLSRRR